jgi:hypothetical protein
MRNLQTISISVSRAGILAVFVIFGCAVCTSLRAQPSCFDCDGAVIFEIPQASAVPITTDNMPSEIVSSYRWFDSLCRLGLDINQVDSLFDSFTFSDTSRRFLKRLYEINDYDPVAYWQILMSYSNRYESQPWLVQHSFLVHVANEYPNKISGLLGYADIIAHVKVVDTFSSINDSATYSKSILGVTCLVIDTLKGHNWPSRKYNKRLIRPAEKQTLLLINRDLQFEYSPTWNRMWDIDLINEDSSNWIGKDNEYIVFLRFERLTSSDSSIALTLWPVMNTSTMGTMYPIVNGIVQDPNDDYGFGKGLKVEQWKQALREKIDQLLSAD